MRTLALILLACPLWAGSVLVGDTTYEFDDRYSLKDFTTKTLTDKTIDPGTVIYGSCFSKETPDFVVFPDDMFGVTLINCNLDNVFIPLGNTVIGGSQRQFKVQNDLEDWVVDGTLKPVEPINKEIFILKGISIDPKDIPETKLDEAITVKP